MFELIHNPKSIFYIDNYSRFSPKDCVCIWIHRQLLIQALIRGNLIPDEKTDDAESLTSLLEDGMDEFLDNQAAMSDDVQECWAVSLIGEMETKRDQLENLAMKLRDQMLEADADPFRGLSMPDIIGSGVHQQITENLIENGFKISSVMISTTDWRIRHLCTRDECEKMIKYCKDNYSYFIEEQFFRLYKVFTEHTYPEFFSISGVVTYLQDNDLKKSVVNDCIRALSEEDWGDIDDIKLHRPDF